MSIENPMDVQVGGAHYKLMAIQPMEYSMANKLDACQHTAIKYITRFREKGGIQDLEKAKHVIDMLIHFEKKGAEPTKPDVTHCPHCGVGEGVLHRGGCVVNHTVDSTPVTFGERVAEINSELGITVNLGLSCYDQHDQGQNPRIAIDPADVDIYDTDHAADGTLMLDPVTWKTGDVLVCVVPGDSVRYGEKYVYTGDNDNTGRDYMVEVQPLDGGRVLAGQRYANRFRFHSRPTK